MSTIIPPNVESQILARVIAPDEPTLPPAITSELLKWGFGEFDRQRMSELAAKARAGLLTVDEQIEVDGYERVNSFLGLLKSKARSSLRRGSPQCPMDRHLREQVWQSANACCEYCRLPQEFTDAS